MAERPYRQGVIEWFLREEVGAKRCRLRHIAESQSISLTWPIWSGQVYLHKPSGLVSSPLAMTARIGKGSDYSLAANPRRNGGSSIRCEEHESGARVGLFACPL